MKNMAKGILFGMIKSANLQLAPIDKSYIKSFSSKDLKHSGLSYPNNKRLNTIKVNGESAGVVGFVRPMYTGAKKGEAFPIIMIDPKFRGKGLLPKAYKALAEKENLTKFYVTIDKDNPASIKSHMRSGFAELPDNRIRKLQDIGRLKKNQTRLELDISNLKL